MLAGCVNMVHFVCAVNLWWVLSQSRPFAEWKVRWTVNVLRMVKCRICSIFYGDCLAVVHSFNVCFGLLCLIFVRCWWIIAHILLIFIIKYFRLSLCILWEDIWKFWNKYNWSIINQLFLSVFCRFIFITVWAQILTFIYLFCIFIFYNYLSRNNTVIAARRVQNGWNNGARNQCMKQVLVNPV